MNENKTEICFQNGVIYALLSFEIAIHLPGEYNT